MSKAERTRLIVFIFACNLLASFMQSIMNIALDQVASEFHIRLAQANYVIILYAIVAGTVITMAASLLKRFGLRKIMLFGLFTGFIGSLLGFLAWDFPIMVAARIIQALTTGLYFPVINEALLTLSPKGKAGLLLSVNSGVIGFGLAIAPPVAGLLITYAGLKSLFLVPTILAAVLIALGFVCLRDIYPRADQPIDALSVALSFVGLGAFMVGLNEVTHYLVPMLALMIFGILVIALFVIRQLKIKHPLLDMTPFKTKPFVVGEILIVLAYMASMYLSLLVPLYLEGAAGKSAFIAGCMLVVPILCYASLCFVSGRELGRHGVWPLVPLGFVVVVCGIAAMIFTAPLISAIPIVICTAFVYGGVGLLYPAVKSVDLEVLPTEVSSNGSAIHSTLVQIAGCISSALFVGIMSGDVHSMIARGVAKADAYATGFEHTLFIEIGFVIIGLIVSFIYVKLIRNYKKTDTK